MKTIFKTKTGSNVQEAISKSLAVLTSIALVSVSLNAQDLDYSLLEKSRLNETALVMAYNTAEISPVTNDATIFIAFIETETEEALELEDWMMNESNFLTFSFIETESESPLELENWMTNETLFNANSTYFEIETEVALELESWMTNETIFRNSPSLFTQETEKAMELENWMFNEDLFSTSVNVEQPLQLEDWMISELTWR